MVYYPFGWKCGTKFRRGFQAAEPTTKKFFLILSEWLVSENGKRKVVAVECSFDFISQENKANSDKFVNGQFAIGELG